ncbi:MAG: ABC transporter permease [Bacteroidales bacterium]|nr:ABC transporter permease [Candidatus Colimorpha pelethequi]
MTLFDTLKISLHALGRNKMRTMLTMLGIVIGISSVIIMMSLGKSLTTYMNDTFSSFGANTIGVSAAWEREGGYWHSRCDLGANDYEVLKNQCRHVAYVSPVENTGCAVVFGANSTNTTIEGVSEEYEKIGNLHIRHGRMFTQEEVLGCSKVCIVGQSVVDKLFTHHENPIGQTIRCRNIPMQIIGVLEPMGKIMGQDMDNNIYAPYTTIMKRFMGSEYFDYFELLPNNLKESELAVAEIKRCMRNAHGLEGDEPDDIEVTIAQDQLESLNKVLDIVVLVLALIAGISLIVGGVGIMNIMYVTVTERTREIGIRMAVGAQGKDILRQFLLESVVLSLAGGLVGALLGFGISAIVTSVADLPFVVSGSALLTSFGVCTAVGVFFGWYPAKRAANLDPIAAIRYE